jgi:DNA-binding transcriptional MerR regulator
MSTKVDNKHILGKSVFSTREHTLIDSQSLTYRSYESQIDHNIKIILHKYQHLDIKKVRQLLEELDNQLELAIEILEEEIARSLPIIEEPR